MYPSPPKTREPSLESPNSAVLGLAGDRSDDAGPANAGPANAQHATTQYATTQRQSAKFRSLNFQPAICQPANDHFADFKSANSQPYNVRFEPAKVQAVEAAGRPRVSMQSVKQRLIHEVPANAKTAAWLSVKSNNIEPNNAELNNTESDPNIRAVSDVDNVSDAGVVSGTGVEMYKGSDNE
ncbi:hypothetical protein OEA41_003876 [Lepraria neglecta]|uniref:Uncharacterized protein n=1 Tax=Lepraria neglecta TaxID=209136 RepID=A0AAE0DIU7_9LECA|nr:hypothetical protein OEA41_003876 [Lepraria neglecta]